jgi:hypothetical protein
VNKNSLSLINGRTYLNIKGYIKLGL